MKKIKFKKAGFTLIEMLAVLFIIGIVFSITMPTFGPIMGTLKLTTATENIANALESARQHASTSGQDCFVVFATSGDMAYKAYKLYSSSKTIGKVETLPKGIEIGRDSNFPGTSMSVPFPEDTSPSQSVSYIKFEPDGSPEEAGSIKVVDQNTNTFQKITFSATPRKVTVKEIGED